MFMVYINFKGRRVEQKVVSAKTLEQAIESALFDYVTFSGIEFEEVYLVEAQGHKI